MEKLFDINLRGYVTVRTDIGELLNESGIRLLEAIDETGSINRATRLLPLSYKAAWKAIEQMNCLARSHLAHGGVAVSFRYLLWRSRDLRHTQSRIQYRPSKRGEKC